MGVVLTVRTVVGGRLGGTRLPTIILLLLGVGLSIAGLLDGTRTSVLIGLGI